MSKTVCFIGGGQMAEALIKGMLQSNEFTTDFIVVVEPVKARRDYLENNYKVKTAVSAKQILKASHVILIAVKPQVMPEVLKALKPVLAGQLIITIAAGLPLSFYSALLDKPDTPIIRVMPNTPALILEGVSALCRNNIVSDDYLAYAESLFKSVGTTVVVDEKAMDAVTGLSGSGPAYVFSFIEALIDGGVKVGLSREIASKLVIQTILGSTNLVKQTGEHPAVLRDRVTSPGGTTASGLHVLENSGFNGTIINMVEAAYQRSIELGNVR